MHLSPTGRSRGSIERFCCSSKFDKHSSKTRSFRRACLADTIPGAGVGTRAGEGAFPGFWLACTWISRTPLLLSRNAPLGQTAGQVHPSGVEHWPLYPFLRRSLLSGSQEARDVATSIQKQTNTTKPNSEGKMMTEKTPRVGPEGVFGPVLFWNWPSSVHVAVSARDAGAHRDSSFPVLSSRAIADHGLPTSSPQRPGSQPPNPPGCSREYF